MNFNTILLRLGFNPADFENVYSEPIETESGYIYEVSQKIGNRICPHCQSKNVIIHDHDTVEINCRSTDQIEDILRIRKTRLLCKDCKKTYTPALPGIEKYAKVSDQTVRMIVNDFFKMITFSDIATRYGLSTARIIQIFDKKINHVPRKSLPLALCIDEKRFAEEINQKFCCILYDFDTGDVVDVIKNRQLAYLIEYFEAIPEKERNGVLYFMSDMNESFKTIKRKFFPKALYVVDLFHVVKLFTQAVKKIRVKAMHKYEKDSIEYSFMKKHWKLFQCRKEDIPNKLFTYKKTQEEYPLYDMVFKCVTNDTLFNQAYNILQDLYHYNEKQIFTEAFEFVMYIAERCILTGDEALETIGRTYKRWAGEIANSLAYSQSGRRFSNSVAEGDNNHIQTIIKIAYGYHNFERFRKRVLLIKTYKKDLKK